MPPRVHEMTKALYKIPLEPLKFLALGSRDELPDNHAFIRSAVAERTLICPPSFNPAICDSVGVKGRKRASIRQQTPMEWDIPGHGKTGRGCGRIRSVTACENGDYFQPVMCHCWRLSCPHCWWDTAKRKSAEICERLDAYGKIAPLTARDCWQHVVVSPPQDTAKNLMCSSEGYAHIRLAATSLIRDLGITGGAIIFHPYRENGEDDYNNRIQTGNDGQSGHWRTAPHFHIVGYGFIPSEKVAETYERTGWIVKSVRSHLGKNDRIGVLNYLLTHVGIGRIENRRNVQSFQYFGGCVASLMPKIADVERIDMPPCPNCGGALFDVEITGDFMPTEYKPHRKQNVGGLYCSRSKTDMLQKEIQNLPMSDVVKHSKNDPEIYLSISDPDNIILRIRPPKKHP